MKNYKKALDTGQVVLQKSWQNPRKKKQISLLWQQRQENQSSASALIAFEQGMSFASNPTTIRSMNVKEFKKLGIPTDYDYRDNEDGLSIVFANDIYDEVRTQPDKTKLDMNIQVVENTTKNINNPSQTPKINPTSGEVLQYKGEDIYRHTYLVIDDPNHQFLNHDVADGSSKKASKKKVKMETVIDGEPA